MPFGITVAGDIFQWKIDQCFSHLKNVIIIADDIMVVGKSQKEHDQALTTLLEMAGKCNVQLNYNKLQYKKTEIDFFGENLHDWWVQSGKNQSIHHNHNAGTKLQKRIPIIYMYDQLFIQVLCQIIQTVWTH